MCYIELVVKESDNNIKLIVLDRLFSLKDNPAQEKILQDLVMDILRVLSSTDLEVRRKALKLVSELVTSRIVDEVRLHCWCVVLHTYGGSVLHIAPHCSDSAVFVLPLSLCNCLSILSCVCGIFPLLPLPLPFCPSPSPSVPIPLLSPSCPSLSSAPTLPSGDSCAEEGALQH